MCSLSLFSYSFVQDFVQETSFENDFIVIQASSLDILSLISNITVKKSQAMKRKQKKGILKAQRKFLVVKF